MDVPLADAVAALRDELLDATRRSADQSLVFEVGPIELEFEVALRAEAKAGGGLKLWWVLDAKAEATASGTRTHRVKVVLDPKSATGGPLLIKGDASREQGPGDVSTRISD